MTDLAPQNSFCLTQATTEEWRPVVGFEGLYEVSSLGRVRSLDRIVTRTVKGAAQAVRCRGKLRSLSRTEFGHLAVTLCVDGAELNAKVHKLVAEAFIGPCPEGMEACHNDGVPSNNHVHNIRYDTHTANLADAIIHGTFQMGERHYKTRFTCDDVNNIFHLSKSVSQGEIARRYGCHQPTISKILSGKNWRHHGQ